VTNYLIPRVTHEWQKHDQQIQLENSLYQREVEIKSGLAQKIGESSSAFLAAMHLTELSWRGAPGPAYDSAYEAWSVSSNGIASQLRVYFPDTRLHARWVEYYENACKVYYLLKQGGPVGLKTEKRMALLREMKGYLKDNQLDDQQLREIARYDAPRGDVNALLDSYLKRLLQDFSVRANELLNTMRRSPTVLRDLRPGSVPGKTVVVARGGSTSGA